MVMSTPTTIHEGPQPPSTNHEENPPPPLPNSDEDPPPPYTNGDECPTPPPTNGDKHPPPTNGNDAHHSLSLPSPCRGLSDAPQIPAGFRSFPWIPEELILAETSAKITIPGVTNSGGMHSFRN